MTPATEPFDLVKIVSDLLKHAVYDMERSDECIDAVEHAKAYLKHERPNRLLQRARDISADVVAKNGGNSGYVESLRKGVCDDYVIVRAVLAALQEGSKA